jgi:hypothetical protein
MAKLVAAGVTLRDQLNERFPKRDKRSDGWIGNSEHASRVSDHNPDRKGWVHALDIDEDFGAPGDAERFATQLVEYCRAGLDHGRVQNIVYENRVASGTFRNTFWTWRHDAKLGHTKHIHVSFTAKAETDGRPFNLPIFATGPAPAKKTPAKKTAKKAATP